MAVLGFSSSPIIGGNVDRMVQAVLDRTGVATQFFNLTELSFGPCRACAHLCAKDNRCKLDDDLKHLMIELDPAKPSFWERPFNMAT